MEEQNYKNALYAAGYTVEFMRPIDDDSYTGKFIAYIKMGDKERWIYEEYGSCEGCDPYLSFMDYNHPTFEKNKEFGERLILSMMTYEELVHKLKQEASYDVDAEHMLRRIKKFQPCNFEKSPT